MHLGLDDRISENVKNRPKLAAFIDMIREENAADDLVTAGGRIAAYGEGVGKGQGPGVAVLAYRASERCRCCRLSRRPRLACP